MHKNYFNNKIKFSVSLLKVFNKNCSIVNIKYLKMFV